MPNVILTPQLLTKLTVANLGGRVRVCRNMSTEYASTFAKKGNKQGDTLQVRKPQRFIPTDGLAYQPQPISNTQTPITVDQVTGVHFEFDSVERTLSLDDINERYAKPAAIALADNINARAAKYIAINTWNQVGTPGVVPTAMLTYLAAGDKLVEMGVPDNEDLAMIINRKMSSTYVDASKALFNATSVIGGQQKKGQVVDTLGYNWEIDQTIYTHVTGTWAGTIVVNGANQFQEGGNNGTGTLVTSGHTSGTSTIKAGDVFTIAAVNSVHPQTRQSNGSLQQFVALTTQLDVSGAMTIVMAPALTSSGQYQNIDAAPANAAAVTISGASGTSSPQALLLHKDAFAFLSVPLEDPAANGVEMVSRQTDPDTGLVLSFIRTFDPIARKHINRFDTLYGFGKLYAELACRVAS